MSWRHYRRPYKKEQVCFSTIQLMVKELMSSLFLLMILGPLITEAYDKMQADLVTAKKSLTKILTSKDIKATVCACVPTH